MKVLVACEFSGIVRDAFLAEGHDAISCDLLPTESPGPHVQGDVRPLLREPWDLVIAHPPCTYLSTARGAPSDDDDAILEALEFFIDCQNANAPMVAVENPGIYIFAQHILGKPNCKVHPWQFGDLYLKRTYFWLKGVPPLLPLIGGTDQIFPSWISGRNSKAHYNRPGIHKNSKKRSEFHPGMAAAMAQQWGNYKLEVKQ